MRKLALVGVMALCVPALARERRSARPPAQILHTDPHVAFVDDEPMSHEAARPAPSTGLDTGTVRDIQFASPRLSEVGAAPGTLVERGAGEDPAKLRADDFRPVSGSLEELAARQMRKHQPSIDGCVAAARKRSPAATGALTLAILVGDRKVAFADVRADSVNDKELSSCLLTAARGWTFSLSHASFTHPVVLSAQASR